MSTTLKRIFRPIVPVTAVLAPFDPTGPDGPGSSGHPAPPVHRWSTSAWSRSLASCSVIGLAAVGCGSGANGARQSTRSAGGTVSGPAIAVSATTPAAAAGAGTAGLRRFLLGSGDEPGYSDQGTADVSSSLGYWLRMYPTDNGEVDHGAGVLADPTAAANRPQQFRADGWVAGATIQLTGVNGGSGVSTVHELRSVAGARADWEWRVKYIPLAALTTVTYPLFASKTIRFTVPPVPTAVGYAAASSDHGDDGAFVAWIEGRCVLYLGNEGNAEPLASFTARIRDGVKAIYRRTSGACPE